mmetsp:Transcript_21276/g.27283  ORF Transcript_21276/g.27283 Transcript_21276/m.27283 type:complete len:231 (+) Transcript_21276:1233-1925(+)
MRNGEVRKVAISGIRVGRCDEAKGGIGQVIVTEHHSLRYASTPTGINNRRHLLPRPLLHLLDLLPLRAIRPRIVTQALRTQRKTNALHSIRNPILHLRPRLLVQLPHEEKLGLRMLERVLDRLGREGRVDGHADVARHHDCEVGHEPPRAVLGHDGDLGGDGEVEALDVGGHFFRFGEELGEGPFLDDLASHWLGEEGSVGGFGAVVEDVVGDDLAIFLFGEWRCHGGVG